MFALSLSSHLSRLLVLAESEETAMPEVIVRCPLQELEPAHQLRIQGHRHSFIFSAVNPSPRSEGSGAIAGSGFGQKAVRLGARSLALGPSGFLIPPRAREKPENVINYFPKSETARRLRTFPMACRECPEPTCLIRRTMPSR